MSTAQKKKSKGPELKAENGKQNPPGFESPSPMSFASAVSKGNPKPVKTASNGSVHTFERDSTPNVATEIDKNTMQALFHRTLWITMNLIGKFVEVTTKSGDVYEGILHTATTDKGMGVALKMARKKEKDGSNSARPIDNFVIYPSEFVQLTAKDVSLDTRIRGEKDFGTDTDISGFGSNLRERELQPWTAGEGHDLEAFSFDAPNRDRKGWDQFATNKALFGVETTWDENQYTIPLDKRSAQYKSKASEAARIADEIERGITSNSHMAEERGQQASHEEIDEEDRYSTVMRDQSNITLDSKRSEGGRVGGKYVPPHQRSEKDTPEPSLDKANAAQPPAGSKLRRYDSNIESSTTQTAPAPMSLRASADQTNLNDLARLSPSGQPGSEGLINERLRLRDFMVSERYKNSAPIANDVHFSQRSPLSSPLVGNIYNVNALALEPATPQISNDLMADFLKFKLDASTKRQAEEKEKTIGDFKDFSFNLTKSFDKSKSVDKSSPPTSVPAATPTAAPTAAAPPTRKDSKPSLPTAEQKKPQEKREEKKEEKKENSKPRKEEKREVKKQGSSKALNEEANKNRSSTDKTAEKKVEKPKNEKEQTIETPTTAVKTTKPEEKKEEKKEEKEKTEVEEKKSLEEPTNGKEEEIDYNDMKVPELKAECEKRGIDTKNLRLKKQLVEALSQESPVKGKEEDNLTSSQIESSSQSGTPKRRASNPPRPEELPSTPTKRCRSGTPKTSPSQERSSQEVNPSPKRSRLHKRAANQKPVVMFTGIVDEERAKVITRLGGQLCSHANMGCTHVVTDKIKRTVKFMSALCVPAQFVHFNWIDECETAGHFVEEEPFLIRDVEGEERYKFNLLESCHMAATQKIMQGYKIHMTSKTKPSPTEFEEVIQSAGGTLSGKPGGHDEKTIIVSCEEDRKLWPGLRKMGYKIHSTELLLSAVLQQRWDMNGHQLN